MPRVFLTLALLCLTACDSVDGAVLEGRYSGIVDASDPVNPVTLTVTIPETEGPGLFSFTSSRVIRGSFDEIILGSAVGTGTYNHPEVTLVLEGETLVGTVSNDRDEIRLGVEAPTVLTRETSSRSE